MTASPHPHMAEILHASESFIARRFGRYITIELLSPHRVLSTSIH